MPTILLVRHAQASFGSADYDVLSPLGVEQATVLNATLARRELNVTRVAAGTARRQRETAEPLARDLGLEIEVDERWNEYETDEVLAHHASAAVSLDGTGPAGEITSRDFQQVLDGALDDWVECGPESPAGQTWPQFFASRSEAMRDLGGALGSGETGVVFTSGGAIAAVCARLLNVHADLFPKLNRVLVNTGITKIVVGRSGPSLLTFNEHAHIDDGGGRLLTYR